MVSPTSVVLGVVLLAAVAIVWYYDGHEWWRSLTADRFIYGVPWGTTLVVVVIVAFYLFVQQGLTHWDDPLAIPFVSWSYFYPLGIVTSGFSHGSPGHITGNMAGTIAFGVVAEYVWGHYPVHRRADTSPTTGGGDETDGDEIGGTPADDGPVGTDEESAEASDDGLEDIDDELLPDGGPVTPTRDRGWLDRPWVRALVVVPAAMFGVAFLTAAFSLGPALGFSGAVFGIAGFAIVTRPTAGLVAVAASSALGVVYNALATPLVRGTTAPGAPGPPSWASIAFQAHMLGFVIGAALGIGLLFARRRRLSPSRVFFGTLTFGLALTLWLLVFPESADVFVLYRGIGVTIVAVLTGLVTVAATGRDEPIPRIAALVWLALAALVLTFGVLGLGSALTGAFDGSEAGIALVSSLLLVAFAFLLGIPAIPSSFPDRFDRLASQRGVALLLLVAFAGILAAFGAFSSVTTADDAGVTDTGEIQVGDYIVTYAEDVPVGRESTLLGSTNESDSETRSGLIVVSEQRAIWTPPADADKVAYTGNESVHLGGLGWRETVHANRTGWAVTGNESAYAVDLIHDGETTRSFTSEHVTADVTIDGHSVAVDPEQDGFQLDVRENGSVVGTAPVPTGNETTAAGPIDFRIVTDGDRTEILAESGGTSVTVATLERYPPTIREGMLREDES